MPRITIFLGTLTLCLALAAAASATLVVASSLEELAVSADEIVRGEVVETTPFLRDGRVYTRVLIEVDTAYSDTREPGDIIEIVTLGGRDGDIATRVSGAAEFVVGEHALVFVQATNDGELRSMSLALSAFEIHGEGDESVATRDLSGLRFMVPPGSNNPTVQAIPSQIDLVELEQRIRAALELAE